MDDETPPVLDAKLIRGFLQEFPGLRDGIKNPNLQRFFDQFYCVDDLSLAVLKGHLLIDEMVNRVIESFLFHPECLREVRLTIPQRLSLARSISFREQNNRVWSLIKALNKLRNSMAHCLERVKLQPDLDRIRTHYFAICPDEPRDIDDETLIQYVVLHSMGFIDACEQEAVRCRLWLSRLRQRMNIIRVASVVAGRQPTEADIQERIKRIAQNICVKCGAERPEASNLPCPECGFKDC